MDSSVIIIASALMVKILQLHVFYNNGVTTIQPLLRRLSKRWWRAITTAVSAAAPTVWLYAASLYTFLLHCIRAHRSLL